MDEKKLMKISFAGAVLGIIALYILVLNLNYQQISIGQIDKSMANKVVKVSGEISDFKTGKTTSFTLKNESEIKVVFWEDTLEQLELSGFDLNQLKNGAKIQIVGTIQLYKGEIELIPLRGQIKVI